MSNKKNYPLLPGQTHIEPYYTQVPTEEYEALKREVQQFREISAGSRTTIDDIAEIKTLTSEVNALREMNAKAQEEIATLKENQRWRKFPDEKPSEEGYYNICGSSGFRNADKWTYCKDRQKMDFSFYSYGVKYWMPLPKAPEDK